MDGAKDINAGGQVALIRDVQAYLWTNGVLTPLTGASSNNGPLGMNDVGDFVYGDNSRAVRWRNGVETDLGTLEPIVAYTFPFDINNHGSIVGYTHLHSNNHAHGFLWENGAMRDIGAPLPSSGDVYALAINDSRQIAGSAGDHAFVWRNDTFTDLGILPGYIFSRAVDINRHGHAVGFSEHWVNLLQRPTLWRDGQMIDLGGLSGLTYGQANGINAHTQIVGRLAAAYATMDNLSEAFIWEAGELRNLNRMIDPASGWILRDAAAINDSGAIVGVGFHQSQRHSFLLIPLPEPTSALWVTAMAAAFLVRRARARQCRAGLRH